MRILHIISGLNDGGAEAVLFRLCSHDKMNSHHVISLMGLGKYGPLLQGRGISVTCLGMPRGRITVLGLWRLWRAIRACRANVVQTWMYHADLVGGFVARLAGQRCIVWGIHHTTLVPGESRRGTILIARLCARLSWVIPRHIICCADKALEVHSDMGYDRGRMSVIPNGYDLSIFRPDPDAGRQVRQELSVGETDKVIGFVARFDPQKDHENLIKALAILKRQGDSPHCLLAGAGLHAGNRALSGLISAANLEDNVFLLGQRNDIPAVMNALDLHVMSSAFGEAFPNVIAEAMACGTPCISTDVGDAGEIIGQTGRIVPPREPEALAAAISELLAELGTGPWRERCDAARVRVSQRYAIEHIVESYQGLWQLSSSNRSI